MYAPIEPAGEKDERKQVYNNGDPPAAFASEDLQISALLIIN